MPIVIKLDSRNRILKFCAAGEHWVVASTEHFPLVRDNLAERCKECERQRRGVSQSGNSAEAVTEASSAATKSR